MKSNVWPLQDAKKRFAEVVAQACSDGVQTITREGEPVVVVMAVDDFQCLQPSKKKKSVVEILRECPAPEIFDHIAEARKQADFGRTIDLSK